MEINFVSNLDEYKKAVEESTSDEIFLSNSPHSIFYLGLAYIESLADIGASIYPDIKIIFICDCADDAAICYEAMKIGFKIVKFTGNEIMFGKLKSIASKYGCEIIFDKIQS
ncbi:MAG: hypothetical protein ACK4OM_03100 [Alphaproteobacteria bacterium]